MNWGYVLAIIGSNIGIGALVCGFLVWALSKLDSDIKNLSHKLDSNIKNLSNKLDNDIQAQTFRLDQQAARLDQQNQRTDQLYQMFIDLLKTVQK